MAQKCVHTSCGKMFTDAEESCFYHPGPPIFHEGQKGWKCCKPRVLTFEEFMSIIPCTEGKHSATDAPPIIEKKQNTSTDAPPARVAPPPTRTPIPSASPSNPQPPPLEESEDDDPNLAILNETICKRRACGEKYAGLSRSNEKCCFHPGVPIFHEGSKGYTCCKRRVLEFDEFMKIKGCKTKDRHLFIGSGNNNKVGNSGEEHLETVRHDFYQTSNTVIVSFFLKKIDKVQSRVEFGANEIILNLITTDTIPKLYKKVIPLYNCIDIKASKFEILGSKLEVKLMKTSNASWPVLRSDEPLTGETIQTGNAGKF